LQGARAARPENGIDAAGGLAEIETGVSRRSACHHGVLSRDTAFLEKPFTPGALAAKVRQVLDAKST